MSLGGTSSGGTGSGAPAAVFDYGFDRKIQGKDFDGNLKLSSLGLVANWYLLGNGLRLTAGAFVNNNKLKAAARDEKLEIGDTEYDATLNARLAFERFAPYLGIGWTSGRSGAGSASASMPAPSTTALPICPPRAAPADARFPSPKAQRPRSATVVCLPVWRPN